MELEFRPGRGFLPFAVTPHWVLLAESLSAADVTVYSTLRAHVNPDANKPICWAGQDTLADILKCDQKTLRKSLTRLADLGAIDSTLQKTRTGVRKVYLVHDAPPADYEGHLRLSDYYAARKAAQHPSSEGVREKFPEGSGKNSRRGPGKIPGGVREKFPPNKNKGNKNKGNNTHTPPSSTDSGKSKTAGGCVSDALKNQTPVDADRVEAGMVAARRGIAAGARNKLTGSQLRRATVAVEQAITRGCTPRQITEAVQAEHTDDRTTHPGSAVERALDGLTPAPEGEGVPEGPKGPHRDREADEATAARLAAVVSSAPKREPVTVVERKPGRDWRTLAAAPEACRAPEAAKSESSPEPEPVASRQRTEDDEEAERARQLALLTAEFGLD